MQPQNQLASRGVTHAGLGTGARCRRGANGIRGKSPGTQSFAEEDESPFVGADRNITTASATGRKCLLDGTFQRLPSSAVTKAKVTLDQEVGGSNPCPAASEKPRSGGFSFAAKARGPPPTRY